MRRTSRRISRRLFSKLLGGSVLAVPWVMQQSGTAPQALANPEPIEARWTDAQRREARKAVEAVEKESGTLAKFDVPVAVEPAFVFRAIPVRSRRTPSRAAEGR